MPESDVSHGNRSDRADAAEAEWAPKFSILGVKVSAIAYDEALEKVIAAAIARRPACVSHLAVHGVVEGSRDAHFRAMLDEFEVIAPDGQPVRYALNLLHGTKLRDRCYGPEFMMRVCRRASGEGIGVYLYGSRQEVVKSLKEKLQAQYPELRIVGCEASVFRPLTDEEEGELVERINESGAGVVFVGLGCPLQEQFAHALKSRVKAVLICVGAAFDFHSGMKKMAPAWMQRCSLEWLCRLIQEPRRLFGRYLVTNTVFMCRFSAALIRASLTRLMQKSTAERPSE